MTKKLLTFLTLLTLFFGVGWAAETVYYTLQPVANSGNDASAYATATDITIGDITWSAMGNTTFVPWRIGGKGNANLIRPISSKTAMGSAISKISIELGNGSSTDILNGVTLIVYDDANHTNKLDEISNTNVTPNSSIEFTPSPSYGTEWASNAFYVISLNVKNTSSSNNKYIEFVNAKFYKNSTGPATYSITGATTYTGGRIDASATTGITAGTSITLTAVPETDHELSNLTVDNTDVTSSVNSNNQYTFNMPANDVVVSATFQFTGTGTTYKRVTSLSFNDIGKNFIFVCEDRDAAAGALSGDYLSSKAITITDNETTLPTNSDVLVFKLRGSEGAYQFEDPEGKFLTPTAAKKLSLNANGTETAAITFSDGNAIIAFATSTYGTLQYNYNQGSNSRFLNYTSAQEPIQLYVEDDGTPPATEYDITVTQPEAGGEIAADCTKAAEGVTVTLTATPAEHFTFTSWNVYKTGEATTTVTVSNDNKFTMPGYPVTVEATFTAMTAHSISVTYGTTDKSTAYAGETVTLTPTLPNADKVVDWDNTTVTPSTVEINHSNYTFEMPDADVSVTFAFKDKPNTSEATYIFNTDEGLAALGIAKPADGKGTEIAGNTYTVNNLVSFTSTNGTNGKTVVWNSQGNTDLRVYKGNTKGTFTLSVPTGYKITQIILNGNTVSPLTPSVGSYSLDRAQGTWTGTGDVNEVTFTVGESNIRINTIKVEYEAIETPTVQDLYIIGNVNGIDVEKWHANQGVKMTHSNGVYTADIWVTGKWNGDMQKNAGTFAFFSVLAENNDEGSWGYVNGNRYEPDVRNINNPEQQIGDGHWWLANDANSVNTNVTLLNRNWNDDFLIPAGLYTVTVSEDLTKFNLTVIKDITPTITPDAGEVAAGTNATIALSEDFNTFIANCPKVLECTHGDNGSVYTPLNLTLPEVKLYVNDQAVEGTSSEYTFSANQSPVTITGKGTLLLNGSEITSATKTVSKEYTVVQKYTATIASGIEGGTVAFNNTGSSTTLSEVTEGTTIRVYVNPTSENWELATLTYTVTDGSPVSFIDSYNNEGYYYFSMPAGNVTINATFTYDGPAVTETTYKLVMSNDEIEVGKKYIIVNEEAHKAFVKAYQSKLITINNHTTTISSNSGIAELVLGEGATGTYTFKKGDKYLNNSSSTSLDLDGSADDTNINWTISIGGAEYYFATIASPLNRLIYFLASANNYAGDFRAYAINNYSSNVQLYKEVTVDSESKTLAEIESAGVKSKDYTIEDQLIAVHAAIVGENVYLWCKDQGTAETPVTSINPTFCDTENGQVDYMKDVLKAQGSWIGNQYTPRDWDQSNWVVLKFTPVDEYTSITGAVNHYIEAGTITGTYTDDVNYTITMPAGGLPTGALGDAVTYTPNVYCTANFLDANLNINGGTGPVGAESGKHYFFMNPKVNEVANVTQAVWNGTNFVIAKKDGGNNAADFNGAFSVDWTYNSSGNVSSSLQEGVIYHFKAVLTTVPVSAPSSAPMRDGEGEEEGSSTVIPKPNMTPDAGKKVVALDLTGGENNIVTAVADVNSSKTVAGVKYYNLAGMASDKPFDGVNIIVTTYTDGSRSSAKVLR
ncbi:MAG: hypothetical protein J5523_03470 [Muribaculaceae bacterium]|nr:hypothetical protein [Muribaculaceae bacterium]